MKLILQDNLHAGERGIAATLTEAIHRDVKSLASAEHGGKRIAHGQVVVIMGMEIEMHTGIAFLHLAHILNDLQGIQDTERIGEHEAFDQAFLISILGRSQGVHQAIDILG